ncbi:MAG: sigma-70 family RNA polymerase sigma factor [Spirochaetes bacterium]|jgi:RNA polymerase sigma factor (sigma-70 family)|nr:sigma-70 family RNA polymerase sigma factor [Spirochaetota bacterium]
MEREADLAYDENFVKCYNKYHSAVLSFIYKVIYNLPLSEDLAHDVFLKVYEKNIDLDADSPRTLNFLLTVGKNGALDYLRRRKNEVRKYGLMHFDEVVLNDDLYKEIEDYYIEGEIISTLHDTINSFPENKKKIFVEKNFRNRKSSAIARKHKTSPYKIKKVDEEIRVKIREKVKGLYVSDSN